MGEPAENVPREGAVVAVFDTHTAADAAVRELRQGGFPLDRLSLVGKDGRTEDHLIGFYTNGERMKVWGRRGAFWGGLAGMLSGAAFLMVPGIGHVLVLGPLAHWIMSGLEGAAVVGGVTALGAGLVSFGIPRDAIGRYESSVHGGRFLVVATGTARDIDLARDLLRRCHPAELHDYLRTPMMAAK